MPLFLPQNWRISTQLGYIFLLHLKIHQRKHMSVLLAWACFQLSHVLGLMSGNLYPWFYTLTEIIYEMWDILIRVFWRIEQTLMMAARSRERLLKVPLSAILVAEVSYRGIAFPAKQFPTTELFFFPVPSKEGMQMCIFPRRECRCVSFQGGNADVYLSIA